MLVYYDSDIYAFQNKGNALTKRIHTALDDIGKYIINKDINGELDILVRNYKEAVVLKIVDAVRKGRIMIIYHEDPLVRLPDMLPFVKVKQKGKEEPVAILDLSRFVTKNAEYDPDEKGSTKYLINIAKLHDLLVPTYISLKLYGPSMTLPYEAVRSFSILWADMINQVLSRIGIFASNSDRREAFRYFSMQFYMRYFLHCAEPVVKSISEGALKNGKNPVLIDMETIIERNGYDPYSSFMQFCQVMFNNEVNGIRGLDKAISKSMNFSFFIQKFVEMYGPEAISAFYSVDYFTYVLYVAFKKSDIVRDRAFENITGIGRINVMPKLLQSIMKEL